MSGKRAALEKHSNSIAVSLTIADKNVFQRRLAFLPTTPSETASRKPSVTANP